MSNVDALSGLSIGNLIAGFPFYFSRLRLITRTHLSFPSTLSGEDEFSNASKYAIVGIIFCFALLIPSYLIHNVEVQKWSFFLRFICQVSIYGYLLHVMCNLFSKQKRRWREGLSLYCYLAGTGAPLYLLLALPVTITLGPMIILGDATYSFQLEKSYNHLTGILLYIAGLSVFLAVVGYIFIISWYSKFYKIRRLSAFLALLVCGIVGGPIQLYLVAPFFNSFGAAIDKIVG